MVEYGKHRPPHIYEAGGIYFLSGSTLYQKRLFDTHEKKALLRDRLQTAANKYLQGLKAWVIIDWHYHLLAKVEAKRDLTGFIKSFHGSSAIEINKCDGVTGRQVWYQYWDRFPRSEADYWTFFNYIHINPIKHGLVAVREGMLMVDGEQVRVVQEQLGDFIQFLSHYEFSSFLYYLHKWGRNTMAQLFMDYPLRVGFELD